ncbi:MAG: hypothetical protein R3C09_19705 [Pirellulaceae bacterium]
MQICIVVNVAIQDKIVYLGTGRFTISIVGQDASPIVCLGYSSSPTGPYQTSTIIAPASVAAETPLIPSAHVFESLDFTYSYVRPLMVSDWIAFARHKGNALGTGQRQLS